MNPRPSGPEPDALSTELRALDFFEYNTSCRKWLVDRANSIDPLQTAGPMRVLLARAYRVSGTSRSLRRQILTIIVKIIGQWVK